MLQEQAQRDETAIVVGHNMWWCGQLPGRNKFGASECTKVEGRVEIDEFDMLVCVCADRRGVEGGGDKRGDADGRRRRPEAWVVVEEDGVAGGEGQGEGVPFVARPGSAVDED